jgi:hypothetical protein
MSTGQPPQFALAIQHRIDTHKSGIVNKCADFCQKRCDFAILVGEFAVATDISRIQFKTNFKMPLHSIFASL